MFKLHLFFFAILTFLVVDGGCYTIDDSDYSTLKYSENPTGQQWSLFGGLNSAILDYPAPNGTIITATIRRYPQYIASDNCAIQFSFTGSGITIYVLQAGLLGMSASLTIDLAPAISTALAAPPAPQYYKARVPVFSVQGLVSGNHTVVMSVLDWNNSYSAMMLDYIDVNQAVVTSSTPTTTTPSTGSDSQTTIGAVSATASTSNTDVPLASSKTNVAIIAEGVVAGIAGLLGLGVLAYFCFRRRRRGHTVSLNEGPVLSPGLEPRVAQSVRPFSSTATLFLRPSSGVASLLQDVASTSTAAVPDSTTSTSMTNNDSSSQLPTTTSVGVCSPNPDNVPNLRASPPPVAAAPAGAFPREKSRQHRLLNSVSSTATPSSGDPGVQANPEFTDSQADFVNTLYRNNIPGPIVARVLERMLVSPQSDGSTGANDPELRAHLGMPPQTRAGVLSWLRGASEIGDGETTIGTAPPSYYFVSAQS
ncbi:hypothetical protein BU15DRAFT_61913 [Melanogaster broomeanus]|nr:hypothetical protein BU15DRAFT_61913 [Melanogaster broomeanus]